MGGFAVAVDWNRQDVGAQIEPMLALIPHRATHGTATASFAHAALGEARTEPYDGPATVTTVGRFSIVGDLRLWDRAGLRSRAGGNAATTGMSDRRLILAAYGRTGIGFLDDVDGDYSFVIWDEERRRVLAVRDRFAARALYYEPTANGIRFASEAKQLAITSEQRPEPCTRMVTAYLSNTYPDAHLTFFEGIRKVPPSEYLLASETLTSEREYWRPSFRTEAGLVTDDVPIEFRGRLTESVRRRSQAANGVVAHLSGGLDSSAITAAAASLHGDGALSEPFHTASAVFPGSSLDESPLIAATAALQPFEHHEFVPLTETIGHYASAMWESDGPVTNRIRDLWAGTARIAQTIGADTVLMGSGGDEVVAQDQLLVDLLRQGRLRRWYAGAADEARWYGLPLALTAGYSAARTMPAPNQATPLVARRSAASPPDRGLQPCCECESDVPRGGEAIGHPGSLIHAGRWVSMPPGTRAALSSTKPRKPSTPTSDCTPRTRTSTDPSSSTSRRCLRRSGRSTGAQRLSSDWDSETRSLAQSSTKERRRSLAAT